MTTNDEKQNERMYLLQRLTSQKDAILRASQEIEGLFYQYRVAGKSDPNGELKAEVWKRLHSIIAALSELVPYSNAKKNIMQLFVVYLNTYETIGWTMDSGFTRFFLLLANSIQIHLDTKKGPVVNFGDVSLFKNLIGGLK